MWNLKNLEHHMGDVPRSVSLSEKQGSRIGRTKRVLVFHNILFEVLFDLFQASLTRFSL